jgi:hypothetical protein
MKIPLPTSFRPDPDNPLKTRLYFDGQQSAHFYLRGAISWPEGRREGFALMAGQELKSKKVWIFGEWEFWTVPHWTLEDGTIKPKGEGFWYGLNHFMTQTFGTFGCRSWFWGGQHADLARRYVLQVYRNPMIPIDTSLIEVPYVQQVGDNLIEEWLNLEKLSGDKDSLLFEHLNSPAERSGVHALRCLLAGFEYQPFREV